ncbi:hypothetical protein F4804DRAFT_339606 [Jackrogersella minutella]|nr:hypothetical protein F4804DRAFT_339606 [Jackrogersella minutella]
MPPSRISPHTPSLGALTAVNSAPGSPMKIDRFGSFFHHWTSSSTKVESPDNANVERSRSPLTPSLCPRHRITNAQHAKPLVTDERIRAISSKTDALILKRNKLDDKLFKEHHKCMKNKSTPSEKLLRKHYKLKDRERRHLRKLSQLEDFYKQDTSQAQHYDFIRQLHSQFKNHPSPYLGSPSGSRFKLHPTSVAAFGLDYGQKFPFPWALHRANHDSEEEDTLASSMKINKGEPFDIWDTLFSRIATKEGRNNSSGHDNKREDRESSNKRKRSEHEKYQQSTSSPAETSSGRCKKRARHETVYNRPQVIDAAVHARYDYLMCGAHPVPVSFLIYL